MREANWTRARLILLVTLASLTPQVGWGQEVADSFPGVRLGLVYEAGFEPALAVKPFTSRFGGGGAEVQVEAIIARDLRYSDRFALMDSIPPSLVGEGMDYNLWDQLGATWLLSGQVEGLGEGLVLVLELHDVVYAEMKERGRFPLPDTASDDFRMAVHRISDQVVEWIVGEPGMAASRIAFAMSVGDTAKELYLIDSDGENLRRLTRSSSWTWLLAGSGPSNPGAPANISHRRTTLGVRRSPSVFSETTGQGSSASTLKRTVV